MRRRSAHLTIAGRGVLVRPRRFARVVGIHIGEMLALLNITMLMGIRLVHRERCLIPVASVWRGVSMTIQKSQPIQHALKSSFVPKVNPATHVRL